MSEERITEITSRLSELGSQINLLSAERNVLRYERAELQSHFKVGDRVTYEGAKHVWEVSCVAPGSADPKIYGKKIKKDGTPGKLEQWIYSSRGPIILADSAGA